MPRKLIRDHVPDALRAEGIEPQIKTATFEEFLDLLVDKLVEEANEVRGALKNLDLDEFYLELADVKEVFLNLESIFGTEHIEAARTKKFREKGGFGRRVVLLAEPWKDNLVTPGGVE